MRIKGIICITLVFMMITIATPGLAHNADEHDDILEQILFGRIILVNRGVESASQRTDAQKALLALEYASYLVVDQFNHYGKEKFDFLKNDYKIPGMPKSLDDIDFSANSNHRSYTHRGWNYEYTIDRAHWNTRKNILLATVEKIFDFSVLSGKILGYDFEYSNQCDSFAALVYYIHVLGDYHENESYKVTDIMIPFARNNPGDNNTDIIYELQKHLGVIFNDQKDSRTYKEMVQQLDYYGEKARSLAATTGGINTSEKLQQNQEYVNAVLDLLEDKVPKLLRNEPFFTKVFPYW